MRTARRVRRAIGAGLVGAWAVAAQPMFAAKVMFVTSVSGSGNLSTWPDAIYAGNKTGLEAADAICQRRADLAGIGAGRVFRAWISSGTDDAYCRVRASTGAGQYATRCGGISPLVFAAFTGGPWVRTDGYPFAGIESQLTGTGPLTPPRFDEYGNDVPNGPPPWTGTGDNGTASVGRCGEWTSISDGPSQMAGEVNATIGWSSFNVGHCVDAGRLLCFETGTDGAPLAQYERPGALVFVTSATGTGALATWSLAAGNAGRAAGDAICRNAAAAAGLPSPQSFVAWLSIPGSDAIDRLTIEGPWKLVSGVRFAVSRLDLQGGDPFTALATTERESLVNAHAWTGTFADGTASLSTCSSWTDGTAGVTGGHGRSSLANSRWTADSTAQCNQAHRLYCFSNVVSLFWEPFERGNLSRWSAQQP